MKATLIESDDEHHWVLLDHRVTEVSVDATSLRLQTWSLDGSAEIRLGAPFRLRLARGPERAVDPAVTESMAPALMLLRLGIASLTIAKTGTLTVAFGDRSSIVADPHPRLDAWELHGGGVLEGMTYVCAPGGGPPWL